MQSQMEVNLVFQDWLDNFAPRNLIQSEQNVRVIADYIARKRHGITTTTTLNQAVEALSDKLEFVPEPTAEEKAAAAMAKEKARMQRDIQESKKNQSLAGQAEIAASNAEAAKKAAEARELAAIKAEIAREISGYIKVHISGSIHYSVTEEGRQKLQTVAGNYQALSTVADAKAVLQNVRFAKNRLP